jgi:hypothetical protein
VPKPEASAADSYQPTVALRRPARAPRLRQHNVTLLGIGNGYDLRTVLARQGNRVWGA